MNVLFWPNAMGIFAIVMSCVFMVALIDTEALDIFMSEKYNLYQLLFTFYAQFICMQSVFGCFPSP